ncbi:agamous-like MADS-box protein AGL36 [Durio zibethinus]|uniref:Agamous-like MADS-box protein AGL36 n=1 Tax=Durio zibethinus TaxID=66656 RepID=A0A6P5YVB8_DURZI|nr:agamous-like MADS-box protein AGL36 [Durio zibethinus]
MTRKKVKLAWIVNDSARRASLKKRRLGLLKKVSELTTLCGVDACLIVYSPDEIEPMVWPSHAEVQRQLGEFHKMPESERQKKMMNQETYLTDRVTKAQEQLTKYQRRNKEIEMGHLMNQIDQGKGLDELNLTELHGLTWLVEEKMKEIRKRIEFFQQVPFVTDGPCALGDLSFPPSSPADDLTARIGGASDGLEGDGRSTHAESLLWDQWFIDMMNNSEFKSGARSSSMRSDIGLPDYHPFTGNTADDRGLPRHSFGGSSCVAAITGQPPYRNLRGPPTSDAGLPPLSSRPHGSASDMGLPHESVGSSSFGPFGSDSGQLHPK